MKNREYNDCKFIRYMKSIPNIPSFIIVILILMALHVLTLQLGMQHLSGQWNSQSNNQQVLGVSSKMTTIFYHRFFTP